jgi:hypothetical protein
VTHPTPPGTFTDALYAILTQAGRYVERTIGEPPYFSTVRLVVLS